MERIERAYQAIGIEIWGLIPLRFLHLNFFIRMAFSFSNDSKVEKGKPHCPGCYWEGSNRIPVSEKSLPWSKWVPVMTNCHDVRNKEKRCSWYTKSQKLKGTLYISHSSYKTQPISFEIIEKTLAWPLFSRCHFIGLSWNWHLLLSNMSRWA